MKSNTFTTSLITFGGLMLSAFCQVASADTITQMLTLTLSPNPAYSVFTFNKFNTSLGTLTGAQLSVYSVVQGSFTLTNSSTTNLSYYEGSTGAVLFQSGQDYSSVNNSGDNPLATTPGYFAPVAPGQTLTITINTGQVISNNVTLNLASELSKDQSADGTGTVIFANLFNIGISYGGTTGDTDTYSIAGTSAPTTDTLTYSYTPAVAPEPSTWALLVVGGASLLAVALRKRCST